MRLLKFFSLVLLAAWLFIHIAGTVYAQENTNEELANILVEFETDEVNAKSLNIEEPTTLPGDFDYNWQILKENVGLFFTFNQEKKIEKLEKISNRRLLEAKELAETGTANAANRVEEALRRYEQTREKISTRLENNPELKTKVLEKFDANQLKHQQVLSTVTEELRNLLPENKLENLENIKKANILRWYNADKEKIQERLEKALSNNDVGSKFKQLKNIAVLEEVAENIPPEAKEKIEAAKIRAEERLAEKLANMNEQDREKFEKYINNIKTPELIKQKFISNLKDNQNLPATAREKATTIFNNYSNTLRDKFESLDPEKQQEFLEQFKNATESHPAYIELLEKLRNAKNRSQIQDLLETQSEGIKARIQETTDPIRLKTMEQNLQNYPVLRKQIQNQQMQLKTAPTTVAPEPSVSVTE